MTPHQKGLLEPAIYYILFHHPSACFDLTDKGLYTAKTLENRIRLIPTKRWEEETQLLMDSPLLNSGGIAFLLGENSKGIVRLAVASHKLMIDGYSIKLLLRQIFEVYNCLQLSLPLPMVMASTREQYVSKHNKSQLSEMAGSHKLYQAKVYRSTFPYKYRSLKQKLKKQGQNLHQLLEDALRCFFATPVFGYPVAKQVLSNSRYLTGPFSSIETMEGQQLNNESIIVNVDRANFSDEFGVIDIRTLNPTYCRYMLVVNLMMKPDFIEIHSKYATELHSEDFIGEIHDYLEKKLLE